MKDKTGGPAFPVSHGRDDGKTDGMTLRDYFAGNSPYTITQALHATNARKEIKTDKATIDEISKTMAALNYHYADAMIAERNKLTMEPKNEQ